MAYKIYVKSNYFYIVDTENDKIYEGLAKDVRVRKEFVDSTSFIFENVNGLSTSLQIPFASIQDENGDAYSDLATFVAFYEANTGNFNSGGATPQVNDKENIVSGVVASGTNTYTATYVPTITEYEDGLKVLVRFPNANTSTATLNLNGLGAKAIVKGASSALDSGDIPSGVTLLLAYDGTNFVIVGSQLVNQFFDWSPTYGGFSTPPSGGVNRYCLMDKLCNFMIMPTTNGTSNATIFTITLPFVSRNLQVIPVSFTIDNGGAVTFGGYAMTAAGSNVLTVSKATGTWTGANGKRAVITGWYEIQ